VLTGPEKKRLKLLTARIDAAQMSGSGFELTPDDERFLDLVALKTSKQNIRRKALGGKTLTAREEARLSADAGAEESPAMFVQNWNELADAIPIDRRTLQNFRDDHADLIAQNKAKLFRADGRKSVPEWRTLIAQCGVKGRGANNPDVNDLDARQLDLAERRFKLRKAEFELNKAEQSMLPVAQFERALAKTLAAFLQQMNAFGPRVNENLEGLDFDERADVIDREVELIRKTLAGCDYLAIEEEEDGG
jgi:hypothetical protein